MPHVQEVRAEGRPSGGSLADEEPVEEVVDQDRELDGVDGFGGYLLHGILALFDVTETAYSPRRVVYPPDGLDKGLPWPTSENHFTRSSQNSSSRPLGE